MIKVNNFSLLKIGLASPERIREWSKGEVKKPDTINYRTLKPEKDGLFCERIFGPVNDWQCQCGKYRRSKYKGTICDRCGVEVTKANVRRERMGHIKLGAPVAHIWYSMPNTYGYHDSIMGILLDMSPRDLEKVLYFASYIVIDAGETGLSAKQLLTEKEYMEAMNKFGHNKFRVGMGAEAIKELLGDINLEVLSIKLKMCLRKSTGEKRLRIIRRLEVVDAFKKSGNKPEWMILDVIPVIPPDLRPMIQLGGGCFAIADLNDLYRRVINRNNRLKRLLDIQAPDTIVRSEKRMLQEGVDALIDNGRRGRPVTGLGDRPLTSLSGMLRGKQGIFRQNLLGKQVDYSGLSVLVVDPDLKLFQCGLPKEMALELFRYHIMGRLIKNGIAHDKKDAKHIVEKVKPIVWEVLEEVVNENYVLLSHTPALQRYNIVAFQPILTNDKTIKMSPLLCETFRIKNGGELMKVHIPLSVEAQTEAKTLMISSNNILAPKDGRPIVSPTQDIVMGIYYLTIYVPWEKGEGRIFSNFNEMLMAYQLDEIELHAMVKVRMEKEFEGNKKSRIIENTVGRFILNETIPQDIGFVDRTKEENLFTLEYDPREKNEKIKPIDKKMLGEIVDKCYRKHGAVKTSLVLEEIKKIGFNYATKGAITIGVTDIAIPEEKKRLLFESDSKIDNIERLFRRGLLSDNERYEQVIKTWQEVTENIASTLMKDLNRLNPIYMMVNSGARGSVNQIRQLAGTRGLVRRVSGKLMECPIKASYKEGLNSIELFNSARENRFDVLIKKELAWMSNYLMRRLINVSHDVIINEYDCSTEEGLWVSEIKDGDEIVEKLEDRLIGRFLLNDVLNPKTGRVIAKKEDLITDEIAKEIVDAKIKSVYIRSVLNCRSRHGVCSKCYGEDLSKGMLISVGEAVGIIAAQSIGEPWRFDTEEHYCTNNVYFNWGNVMRGLTRLEELFEAREPEGPAIISEISGIVVINYTNKKEKEVIVIDEDGERKRYRMPYSSRVMVHDRDFIEVGDKITEGPVNPHKMLNIKGVVGVQTYLLQEVQKVFRLHGIDIHDKHIEVVVRQMLKKVKISDAGYTDLLPGGLIDIFKYEEENNAIAEAGGRKASGKRVLLGITKASLATDSFLSAASFQETTRVLTEASIKGKEDPLSGPIENIIIGKTAPVGTRIRELNYTY